MGNTDNAQFDAYSENYNDHVDKSVKFSGQSSDFFHRIKACVLLSLLQRYQKLDCASVLDVGCGTGSLSQLIAPRVAMLAGTDISATSVQQAKLRVPCGEFKVYDGSALPYDDCTFDLVFASCVVHHVPPENWPGFVAEMTRVVRRGGFVSVIEHNPWNPLTRLAVSNCEFDRDAVLLTRATTKRLLRETGLEIVAEPNILFFPLKAKIFRIVERSLAAVPLGAQYIVFGRKD